MSNVSSADICFSSDIFSTYLGIITRPVRFSKDVHSCSWLTGNVDAETLMIRR